MNNAIETIEQDRVTIKIFSDSEPESPRNWDNAARLVIYDKGNYIGANELDVTFRSGDYASWEELEDNVMECYPGCELLPVYRYEHGGVIYNTTGFHVLGILAG